MQSSLFTRKGTCTLVNNSGSSSWEEVKELRGFDFVGFGPNDKRRRTQPTAGYYWINHEFRPWGSNMYREFDYSGNPIQLAQHNGGMGGIHGSFWNYSNSSPQYNATVYNEALEKLYEDIRQAEANIALSLGEARETAKMLKAFRSLSELIQMARRVRRLAVRNPSKLISEIWLSYKYGWQPLLNDIYSYLEWTTRRFDEMTFKGRRSRNEFTVSNTSSGDYKVRIQVRRQWKAEVSVTAKVSDPNAFDLSRITTLNPLSLAWELLPLSFVVDWLINIGGYLQLQEAALGSGLTFVRGYETQVAIVKWDEHWRKYVVIQSALSTVLHEGSDHTGIHRVIKQRNVLTGFPRPVLPKLEIKLGAQRILSAAALIRVILLGKVK